ncbi:MAG: hypothetical protein HYT83_03905 [Candidatus Levybacteria bacterium]|nr:hypothetical protein [Candidatus Levybacteria bacterium]
MLVRKEVMPISTGQMKDHVVKQVMDWMGRRGSEPSSGIPDITELGRDVIAFPKVNIPKVNTPLQTVFEKAVEKRGKIPESKPIAS